MTAPSYCINRQNGVLGSLARRAFWLVMFVGHLPPLVATLGDGRLYSAAVLMASEILFLLKLVDVAWLRLPSGRRAFLASVVVIVLLHAPVLTRASAHAEQALPWHVVVLVGGTGCLAFARRRRSNRLASVKPRRVRDRARCEWSGVTRRALDSWLPPRFLPLRSHLFDRSPPACA